MHFEFTERLWLLLLLIPQAVLFYLYFRNRLKNLQKHFNEQNFNLVFSDFSRNKPLTKFILYSSALVLSVFAFANPLERNNNSADKRAKGCDIMFVTDISNSMRCEDIKPNRLNRAKQIIYSITERLGSDRVGLVLFAGEAYQMLPMTIDHAAFRMFVSDMDPEMIQPQGTAIGNALQVSYDALARSKAEKPVLVLLSDGENFDGFPSEIIAAYQKKKIRINTISVGTHAGAPVPIYEEGVKTGQKKDDEGKLIISRPDEDFLEKIATSTGGTFVPSTEINNAPEIIGKALKESEKSESKSFNTSMYHSIYQWFLLPAILLLLIDWLILEKRMGWQKKLKQFVERRQI